MLNTSEAALFLLKMQTSFAQVVVDPITSKEAALVFSGSQFLVVLLAGVMMAFGFQLLLTNLSIAYLVSPGGTDVATDDLDDSSSLGSSIRKIEAKVGIWALATVSLALLAACFLAVKLSLINSITLGAIVGVVVWSTYLLDFDVVWLNHDRFASRLDRQNGYFWSTRAVRNGNFSDRGKCCQKSSSFNG